MIKTLSSLDRTGFSFCAERALFAAVSSLFAAVSSLFAAVSSLFAAVSLIVAIRTAWAGFA